MATTTLPSQSLTEFLALLRRSKLLEPSDLANYLSTVQNAELMSATEMAERMKADGLITDFQAHHLLRGRYKNFYIGKYKVIAPLGSGGMSQVYLCEHTVMKHRVALKLLPIKDTSDAQAVARFQREARAAAAVNHPNVVRAHDVDQAEGKIYYLVMDYIDGVNLHDLVRRIGPLVPEQAANYIAQAAVGLQEIASKGLIHRDLKPSNLLLDRDGVVRILDLGLARFTDDSQDNVTKQFQSDSVFGTADYLAPEQALQLPDIDARSDIYSLGATLYFLLSGSAPFEAASVAQKLLAHQMRDPDPIEGVPDELQAVMFKMMQKRPEDRYADAYEVVEALAPWASEPLPPPTDDFFTSAPEGTSGPVTNGPRSASSPSTAGIGKTLAGRGIQTTRFPAPTSNILGSALGRKSAGGGKKRLLIFATAGIGTLALLIGGLFAAGVFKFDADRVVTGGDSSGTSQPRRDPDKPVPPPAGSLAVGTKYKTVAEALAKAKTGSRIVIVTPDHTESLSLEKLPKGVTIQGWPETRKVVWRSAGNGPAITGSNPKDLTLQNIAFEGSDTNRSLVELRGDCAGLTISNCLFSKFADQAISMPDVRALDKPMTLDGLRIVHDRGVGISFGKVANTFVQNSRFEGPLDTAIRIGSGSDNVTVRSCRFHRNAAGVTLSGEPAGGGVQVLNNCFAECRGAAMAFAKLPNSADRVHFKNNLIYKCGSTTSVAEWQGQKLEPGHATWVWHREKLSDDQMINTPEGTRYFRKTFLLPNPASDMVIDIGGVTGFTVWINGQEAGESKPGQFTGRVHAFPAGRFLKPGSNTIAVEVRHSNDSLEPGLSIPGGLVVRVSTPGGSPVVQTDAFWKSHAQAAAGWHQPDFKDTNWPAVWVWTGGNFPWSSTVWDSELRARHVTRDFTSYLVAEGNVRDWLTGEGFPYTHSLRGAIPALAGLDPNDDATFLRIPKTPARLATSGAGGVPVGVR